ncbi:hypothetical protein PP178_06210 [Zeaxanthinibacter sp. PT1]|uniref:hypothetical protein n=1 Tax=Zeaxanthinibacter TaxID=561554 RepID=UPI00234A07A5|nr:hypothetical protein [Zeaxanthinibacter sp. PT1]MDC6351141.1 hypothetical protein [Zeaxanthinibacter sp. PT1]
MRLFAFLLFGFCALGVYSQTDLPQSQPLKIEAGEKLDMNKNPDKSNALNMPSILEDPNPVNLNDALSERNVQMLPQRELKQAGFDLKIDPKVGNTEKGSSGKHFGDMYLGDITTKAKYVGIVCRDHEYVDGDRVKIYANDHVVEPNILLDGSFKGTNITLDRGFNRLDFEALNQGSSGPNTAQVNVYDEKGQLIYSNKWLLSTGSKASLIIVQEAE